MKKLFNNNQEQVIIKEYLEGENSNSLSKKYNCSSGTILKLLKKHSIDRRTGGHQPPEFNNKYFDNINTSKKAYFLGLIAADGSICQPSRGGQMRFQLELIEEDKYLIEILCNELNYDVSKIRKYSRPGRNTTAKITIIDNTFAESLKHHGIVSGKSQTYRIPNQAYKPYTKDFLRGFFDGDGSIGRYRLTLTAGNKNLLEQIKNLLISNLTLNPDAIKIYQTGPKTWTLSVNRKLERLQILEYLYKDSSINMKRKARWLGN